jgi:hypothetical protein
MTAGVILGTIGALLAAAIIIFAVYRSARTYNAGAHSTFLTVRDGEFNGALRRPQTLWNPSIRVLRDKQAPDLTFITHDASGAEYFERSLVTRGTGEISLRVNTCAPRPFVSMTADLHRLRIKARVIFSLDIERIEVTAQLQNFGAAFAARIENLFDNEIGRLPDEGVRARQHEIEANVLNALRAIETGETPGLPLGIHVFEATFSFEEVGYAEYGAPGAGEGDSSPQGVLSIQPQQIDRLLDLLGSREPAAAQTLMALLEMQTRQNIVELLCKSGGLVAFTAEELGLSHRRIERAGHGVNIMKPMDPPPAPAPAAAPAANGTAAPPAGPTSYYDLPTPVAAKAARSAGA